MIAKPPDRAPDAATFPRPYVAPGYDPRRPETATNVMRDFMEKPFDLRGRRIYCRNQQTFYFVTTHPDDQGLFPSGHPLHPRERYDWFSVTDDRLQYLASPVPVRSWAEAERTVKFGWLADEDAIEVPDLEAKAAHARATDARALEYQEKQRRLSELTTKGRLDADDREEMAEILEYLNRLATEGVSAVGSSPVLVPRADA